MILLLFLALPLWADQDLSPRYQEAEQIITGRHISGKMQHQKNLDFVVINKQYIVLGHFNNSGYTNNQMLSDNWEHPISYELEPGLTVELPGPPPRNFAEEPFVVYENQRRK